MARTHRAYPLEFRRQTVDPKRSGGTPDELARGYDLLEQIKTIWQSNREAYGRPRIHTEPSPAGERVSPKRVGRLMRRAGIEGAGRPKSTKATTGNERTTRLAPDLVDPVAVAAETELRTRAAPTAEIEELRSCVQAPNQAKRSHAPTHAPCTGQDIVHARARASARNTATVIG